MSEETNCSLVTSKIPSHLLSFDAFSKISLISSTEVGFSETKVISAIEPQATGTLKAIPSNLPSKSLITLPAHFAAPVLEGIIF